MEIVIENPFKYRFVLYNPFKRHTIEGNFLFEAPVDARDTQLALKETHVEYEIWLEDRDGNRVAIPR